MKNLLQEFKDFAMRGSVLDLAVGIIIGAAFGAIVNSLVADIIMPPIGKAIGGVNFSELQFSLGETIETENVEQEDGTIKVVENKKEAFINYGKFIQEIIDFLIVAAAVFFLVKFVNRWAAKEKAEEEDSEGEISEEVKLLREIRDALAGGPPQT